MADHSAEGGMLLPDLHSLLLAQIDEYATSAVEDGYPVAAPFAALRAVVELHEPTHFLRRPLAVPICEACSADDDIHNERWPCSTIQVIAEQLGIKDQERIEGDERRG